MALFGKSDGNISDKFSTTLAYETEAASIAAGLPALLLEADRIANAVALGVHGRRRPGMGESFWQFRRYRDGDTPASIDWRRSARSHRLYVRDNEWEAAATVWLWLDQNPTMAFRSHLSQVTKSQRALVLLLALGSLLVRGGERIGAFGGGQPARADRQAVPRLAETFCNQQEETTSTALPPDIEVRKYSSLVLMSDFLSPIEELSDRLSALAARGLQGHLVQILDPAEEVFPYEGRHEFKDVAGKARLLVGRAEGLSEAYRQKLSNHRAGLRDLAAGLGWTFTVHHTDRPPSEAMLALYGLLTGNAAAGTRPANAASPTPDASAATGAVG